jgi:hypothetical protein
MAIAAKHHLDVHVMVPVAHDAQKIWLHEKYGMIACMMKIVRLCKPHISILLAMSVCFKTLYKD